MMKKWILTLLLVAPLFAFAQTKSITSLYNSYTDRRGVTTMMVSGNMLSSMLNANGKTVNGSMLVISAERSLTVSSKDLATLKAEAMKIVAAPGYKIWMDIKDDDNETVRIYAKDGAVKGELAGVMVIISEEDEVTVIGVDGTISADLIGKLTNAADQD